jgi:hypothetical protein
VAGAALRPVERMRARAAAIGDAELGERLPEPGTGDELGLQLTLAFASVVALVLAATGVVIYTEFRRKLDRALQDDLAERAVAVAAAKPRKTTFPVMLATNTCPSFR